TDEAEVLARAAAEGLAVGRLGPGVSRPRLPGVGRGRGRPRHRSAGSALRTLYEHDPDHRPDVPDAIGRRLLRRRIHRVPVQRH
ncbi:hypothetical protein ABZV46_47695, partial [Streptomyces sp. NPDC005209]